MPSSVTRDGITGTQQAQHTRVGTLNLGTYATNGVAVTATQLGLAALDHLSVYPSVGYVAEWDKSAGKVKAYRQKDPAAAGGADIALPEVANGVDLSSVNFRYLAIGD